MPKRDIIFPANRHALYEEHGYSAAVRSGDLLFVSGQVGSREDGSPEPDFRAQAELAFGNLKAVLAAADAEQMAELTWQAMLVGTPEVIPTEVMRADIDSRFAPPTPDVRDGVARGEWGNQVWLDEHRDASFERGVWL